MPIPLVLALFTLVLVWLNACSSGLGRNLPPDDQPATTIANDNLPVGVDLGVRPSAPVGEHAVAGFVLPAFGDNPQREIALVAFTTTAAADNADGAGGRLSRDGATDGNGASDVFLAAVSAQDVERRAFSQSLAGKFRHPRCTTCHSMQAPGTTAFVSSAAANPSQPHAGPPPGPGFPALDGSTCAPCHTNATAVPIPTWKAPAASFDLRTDTVAQLAQRATLIPTGEPNHFTTDERVLWALDSGVLPTVGGRNGAADDDHDGVDEPEDRDGTPRTVPGGSAAFLREISDWNASGRVTSCTQAVRDVTLVSRAGGSPVAGNGGSRRPSLVFVRNLAFNPANPTAQPLGEAVVAFESDATNLGPADGNGATDVYVARYRVLVAEDATTTRALDGLQLQQLGVATLASAVSGGATAGNGASTQPAIGGSNGELVAFRSSATNLVAGFVDGNGAGGDVYVRQLLTNATRLASHVPASTTTGGNGDSAAPALAATGAAIAFDSAASNLLVAADGNGVRDVFHAAVDGSATFVKARSSVGAGGAEAVGGDSGAASVQVGDGGRVLVAYESRATNLGAGASAAGNVYLFDSTAGASTPLNQRITTTGNAVGDGPSSAPKVSPDGSRVAFVSAATNIDVVRQEDGNRSADVFLVEVAQLAGGAVLPFRLSVTANDGADANGASRTPALASFGAGTAFASGLLVYATSATNLGASDATDLMVSFLAETSGIAADFDVDVARGAAPLTVAFTDKSTGLPTSWDWDFENDDEVDATVQNPTFTYTTPGLYDVRLVARNANSEGTTTRVGVVRVVAPPTASFTLTPATGVAPLTVTFTDTSTESPTGWQWDFQNDGVVDSTAQNPTFTYTTPGTFNPRLVVANEAGSAATTLTGAVTAFTPVTASFTRTPASGTTPLLVSFTNTSVGATSFAWDFQNDGVVDSTAQNPTFTYSVAGTFAVRLTATGPGGTNAFTFANCVTANGPIAANFTMTVGGSPRTSAYTNETVTFTSTSTGTITTLQWDFDNNPGTVEATGSPVTRTFSSPTSTTVFNVRLLATGPAGSAALTRALTIVPASESVTLESVADTSIYANAAGASTGNSNGANAQMVCGRAYNPVPPIDNGVRRALLRFDVAGGVPAGSTVLTASLQMACTLNPINPTGSQSIALHRLTRTWTEGTTNLGIGLGAAAAGGDATWASATSGGAAVNWTTAGGDFIAGASASATVDAVGTYTWPTNATMVSNVQGWLTTPAQNAGWIVRANEAAAQRSAKVFGTREDADPAQRPRLTVTFRRPLP
ncbi:MAG: PKD domain-containing protein [Phycisphaerales bacterium]|nr:PKD domain-containing protein [Phycisphaerales bacterium]